MTPAALPIAPSALPDESLSSWIERIALFYGGDYELGLNAVWTFDQTAPLPREIDVDTDLQIRRDVSAWTATEPNHVPALLNPLDALPLRARLAYCPACWDDDVAAGHSPYARRHWACWSTVHCSRHLRWLSARRPISKSESLSAGWAPMWRTREAWAERLELKWYASNERMLVGFDADAVLLPDVDWPALSADLVRCEVASTVPKDADRKMNPCHALLTSIQDSSMVALQFQLAEWLVTDGRCTSHVEQAHSAKPLWLGARVVTLLAAVELLRMSEGREPVDAGTARIVRSGVLQRPRDAPERLINCETIPTNLSNSETFPQKRRRFAREPVPVSPIVRLSQHEIVRKG